MTIFSQVDHMWMSQALELAQRGQYTCTPNPCVGCVIVKDNKLIGSGWHVKSGEPHAEILALRDAGDNAVGATVYSTLEPCAHQGLTPPCVTALAKAKVARVVSALIDPNPSVAGKGLKNLKAVGITTEHGLLENASVSLNLGYISRMTKQIPRVRAKLAMSLDGRTAMSNGESRWITGLHARKDVQLLRAQSCAIITGINTVLQDNPALTVRPNLLPKLSRGWPDADTICKTQPLRVVLDSQLKTPTHSQILTSSGKCLIVCSETACHSKKTVLEQAGAEILMQPHDNQHIDLISLLKELARRQCNEVLIETGATLAGAFLKNQLLDEIIIFMAPILMGSDAKPLFHLPINSLENKNTLQIKDIRKCGHDWRISAIPYKLS